MTERDDGTGQGTGHAAAATRAAEAALTLAAREGWRHVRLADVAAEAGLTLGDLRGVVRDKTDLLRHFLAARDAEVLAEDAGFTAEDGVRDRLFDLLMRRFDALDPYKDGLRGALEDVMRDPIAAMRLAPDGTAALGWYLEAAGVSADGPLGAVRVHGLGLVWLAAVRVWLGDDSADLAATMKALDQALARAESAAGWLEGRAAGGRARDDAPDDPPPADREAEDGAADRPG